MTSNVYSFRNALVTVALAICTSTVLVAGTVAAPLV
jgi:hypothetical protein